MLVQQLTLRVCGGVVDLQSAQKEPRRNGQEEGVCMRPPKVPFCQRFNGGVRSGGTPKEHAGRRARGVNWGQGTG